MKSKNILKKMTFIILLSLIHHIKAIRSIHRMYLKVNTIKLGCRGISTVINPPSIFANPHNIFMEDFVHIQSNAIIYNYLGKFVMKKYSIASVNLVVITGNHVPAVGIPQSILSRLHIGDIEKDIIVEENVWIGANVTLLAGANVGRGAVIGAGSLVNKNIPPYAVVVGTPAKIIKSTFTIEQIIEHEKILYPEKERISLEYLEKLFATYFQGKNSLGVSHISKKDKDMFEQKVREMGIQLYK